MQYLLTCLLAALWLCCSSTVFAQPELTPISEETSETRLVLLLADPEPTIRIQAVERFGTLGFFTDPEAVEHALISMLTTEKDTRVRSIVAVTLGVIECQRAIEPLAALLQDRNPAVRAAAALGLGSLHDTRAIEPVTRLLHDPDVLTRTRAIGALCRFENAQVADPVVPLLQDPDDEIRKYAAWWEKQKK